MSSGKNKHLLDEVREKICKMGHQDVSTTMIYTHVLQQGGHGVPSPLDDLD